MAKEQFILLPTPAHRLSYSGLPPIFSVDIDHNEPGQKIKYTRGVIKGSDQGPVARFGARMKCGENPLPQTEHHIRLLLDSWKIPVDETFYFHWDLDNSTIHLGHQVQVNELSSRVIDKLGLQTLSMLQCLGLRISQYSELPDIASKGICGVQYRILRRIILQFGT